MIVRSLNHEPFETPSSPDSQPHNLRVLIPHVMMGAMIGKGGSRFREIEEASAAKLKAQEYALPHSTDRILFVAGVADAVHIAIYYICTTYISHKEYLGNTRPTFYNPASVAQPPGGSFYGSGPGGYPPQPYGPSGGGHGGPMPYSSRGGGPSSYGAPHYNNAPLQVQPYSSPGASRYSSRVHLGAGGAPPRRNLSSNPGLQRAHQAAQAAPRGEELSQDVYIPNDFVGSVIGKGGAKIKDIRHLSGSRVKINDPIPNGTERLITIWGTPESNETAIYLIHSLIESGKKRNSGVRPNNNDDSANGSASGPVGGNGSGNGNGNASDGGDGPSGPSSEL